MDDEEPTSPQPINDELLRNVFNAVEFDCHPADKLSVHIKWVFRVAGYAFYLRQLCPDSANWHVTIDNKYCDRGAVLGTFPALLEFVAQAIIVATASSTKQKIREALGISDA